MLTGFGFSGENLKGGSRFSGEKNTNCIQTDGTKTDRPKLGRNVRREIFSGRGEREMREKRASENAGSVGSWGIIFNQVRHVADLKPSIW